MENILYFIDIILHLNLYLKDWLNEYGSLSYLFLSLIVFCETGLVVTPFLPGDSLLLAAGSLIASTQLDVHLLVLSLIVAALLGDNCNYWLGRFIGPKVFRDQSRWFKREYLLKTHNFYEKYGAKAIIIARFIPIVRTFTPFVAGIAVMSYKKFLGFSLFAALLWVGLLVYAGYWFGGTEFVQKNFSVLILAVIIISILPAVLSFIKQYHAK